MGGRYEIQEGNEMSKKIKVLIGIGEGIAEAKDDGADNQGLGSDSEILWSA
jgi:hypothetical protein